MMNPLLKAFGLSLLNMVAYLILRIDDVFPQIEKDFIEVSGDHFLMLGLAGMLIKGIQSREKPLVSEEMIRIYDCVIDTRGDREAYIKERVHKTLWFLLILSSMIWLLSFVWLSYQQLNLYLGAFMVLFATFTVVGLLGIARDIDNPIGGMWSIAYKSFDETCEEIDFMLGRMSNGSNTK